MLDLLVQMTEHQISIKRVFVRSIEDSLFVRESGYAGDFDR